MSHAKSEISALKSHLYIFHGFSTSAVQPLTGEQLLQVHSAFHEDEWITLPHSHPAGCDEFGQVETTNATEYFAEVINMVTKEDE